MRNQTRYLRPFVVKFMAVLCCLILCPKISASSGAIPVFPGAQGFGTETKAGRGGKIIKVTNLNDSGSGSLRAAVEATKPRIVVFEVGGMIALTKNIEIKTPYITIAGQTAPSPGITLKNGGIIVRTHDVLVQHLRIRIGDDPNGPDPSTRDGINLNANLDKVYNVVFDHVSVSWAIDENGSTYKGVENITISNSIFSEGLKESLHSKGLHGYGVLIGDHAKNVSLIGNLMAHNMARLPLIKGGASAVVLNNLIYNGGKNGRWTQINNDRYNGPSFLSAVGNVYIPGPDSPSGTAIIVRSSCEKGTKVYISDNIYPGRIFKYYTSFDPRVSSPPVWHNSLVPRKANTVESWVLANAGARPADRDKVDQRIVREVMTRIGKVVNSPQEVGGWYDQQKTYRRLSLPSQPHDDLDGNGYTKIEEFLQQLAKEVEKGG